MISFAEILFSFFIFRNHCGSRDLHHPLYLKLSYDHPSLHLNPHVLIPSKKSLWLHPWILSLRPWPSLAIQPKALLTGTAPSPQRNPNQLAIPLLFIPHHSSNRRTLSALPVPLYLIQSQALPLCLPLLPCLVLLLWCPPFYRQQGWKGRGQLKVRHRQ